MTGVPCLFKWKPFRSSISICMYPKFREREMLGSFFFQAARIGSEVLARDACRSLVAIWARGGEGVLLWNTISAGLS